VGLRGPAYFIGAIAPTFGLSLDWLCRSDINALPCVSQSDPSHEAIRLDARMTPPTGRPGAPAASSGACGSAIDTSINTSPDTIEIADRLLALGHISARQQDHRRRRPPQLRGARRGLLLLGSGA